MLSRHSVFILIAICFIFTYPRIIHSWSLNDSIGWSTRPLETYFIPLWFLLIFFTYTYFKKKIISVSKYFFWTHALLSFIPIFFINYPFIRIATERVTSFERLGNTLSFLNNLVYLYIFSQLVLYYLLAIKLFRKRIR